MFKIGQIIQINPKIFRKVSTDKIEYDMLYGANGYAGIHSEFLFKILEEFEDPYKGKMFLTEVYKAPAFVEIEGNKRLYILAVDAVKANTKITVEYHTDLVKSNQPVIQARKFVDELKAERLKMKASGKDKGDALLRRNWQQLTQAKNELNKLEKEVRNVLLVTVPKHHLTFECDEKYSKDKEALENLIVDRIRNKRYELSKPNKKLKKEKDIFGHLVVLENLVHTEANVYGKLTVQLDTMNINEAKSPKTDDAYVGIELEVLTNKDRNALKLEFIKDRLHKHVQVVHDGSIRPDLDGYYANEIRILCKEPELGSIITRVCRTLRKADGYANRSCGLHIHFDMRHRDVKKIYTNLFRFLPIMKGLQPEHRLKNPNYCMENTSATFEAAMKDYGVRGDPRYQMINPASYSKLRTIEVRVAEGTCEPDIILNWTNFLLRIINLPDKLEESVKTIKESNKLLKIEDDSELGNYIQNRVKECKTLSV